ncbi:hypothetical protein QTO34_012369 [Cnephaeus nilssonii]|uniref:Maestro/Maestro-like HEAT-repeats domain-containing protein n=1 Tax=Cnephaeus nilssonii TaxID=3371016 RepID=A0AA40LDC3_CNENI|nr:hypothetical protein QTO34_012369 [Eptesicus nilssonii]
MRSDSEHLRLNAFEIYGALLAKVKRSFLVAPLKQQLLSSLVLLVAHLADRDARVAQICRRALCRTASLLGWWRLRAVLADRDLWTILRALLEREAGRGQWLLTQSLGLLRSPQAPVRQAAVWFTGGRPLLPATVSSSRPEAGPRRPGSSRAPRRRVSGLGVLGGKLRARWEHRGPLSVVAPPRPPSEKQGRFTFLGKVRRGGWRPCPLWGGGRVGREGGAPSRCSQAPPRLRGALSAVCPAGQIIQSLEVAKASDIAEAWQPRRPGAPGASVPALRSARGDPDPTVSCLATQTLYVLEAGKSRPARTRTSWFCCWRR